MNWKIDTKCAQEGWKPRKGEPRILPIFQSTTFKYETGEQMGDLFDLKEDGFFYSRIANPTVDCVERKIASLEGGVGALLCSSGQAAIMTSILNIAKSGDHIIVSSAIYGGTYNLTRKTLYDLGIQVSYTDINADDETISGLFRDNTKLVFAETLSNPSLDVLDIEKFARVAHEHGVPLLVDNTFPTPVLCRPFEWGADIVLHSTSKYMDGHAAVLGGVIVDSGRFPWTDGKFPALCTPDESYHGVTYTEKFGPSAYIVKARVHLMRDMGVTMSPNSAFLLNLGLETLALRIRRHSENALAVAKFLETDSHVVWVRYPGLESYSARALAKKYLPAGASGVVSFGVKGGREAASAFMERLKLAAIVTHVADLRTSVLHPASTTHRQMTDKELCECGVTPDLVRFSVGIEDVEDIIADLEQALR